MLAGQDVLKKETLNNLLNSFVVRLERDSLAFDQVISFFELYTSLVRQSATLHDVLDHGVLFE